MQTISPVHLLCYLTSILVLWGRQNNGSPTQVSKSWNLSLCYLTWQMDFADEIKWRIWDREILLDYAGGPNILISESEAGGSQTERDVTTEAVDRVVQLPEGVAHKPRHADSLQKLEETRRQAFLKRNAVLLAPWCVACWDALQTSELQDCEMINLCCCKLPALWQLVPAARVSF